MLLNAATTAPSHELVMKGGTQDTPQGSGNTAYGNQEQYSCDCSEEPEISWSDAPQTKADKRSAISLLSCTRFLQVKFCNDIRSLTQCWAHAGAN